MSVIQFELSDVYNARVDHVLIGHTSIIADFEYMHHGREHQPLRAHAPQVCILQTFRQTVQMRVRICKYVKNEI